MDKLSPEQRRKNMQAIGSKDTKLKKPPHDSYE